MKLDKKNIFKINKNILSLLFIFLLSLFVGCGGSEGCSVVKHWDETNFFFNFSDLNNNIVLNKKYSWSDKDSIKFLSNNYDYVNSESSRINPHEDMSIKSNRNLYKEAYNNLKIKNYLILKTNLPYGVRKENCGDYYIKNKDYNYGNNFKIKFLTTKDLYNKIKLPTTFSNNLQIDCNDGIRAQSFLGNELINPSPLFTNLENTHKLCKITDLNSKEQLIAGFDVGHLEIQGDLKKAIESEWFQPIGNEEIVSTSSYVVEDFVKSETPIQNLTNIIDDYYKINKTINGNVKKYEFEKNQTFYYDNSSGFFIISKNNDYDFTETLPNINLENQYTRFLSVRNYKHNKPQVISYEKPASSFSGNFDGDEKYFPIYIIDYSYYSFKPFTNEICLNSLKDSIKKPKNPIPSYILKDNKVICDAENRKIYISSLAFDDNIEAYYLAQNIATTFIR